ncbi:MAG: glycine cleavage system protein GcvH [Chthonomonadales bacterium]
MGVPSDLKYSKSHEWVRVSGDTATLGITDHAQEELGDIVYLDLPEVGRIIGKESIFGAVESVKAVSDLYSPVSGEVIEANTVIGDATETVNQDPFGDGWMVKIRMSDTSELAELMTAEEYDHLIESSAH